MTYKIGDARRMLSYALLRVFEQARRQRELAVADLVLCALEELARKDTNCQGTLDRAYLQSVAVGTIVDVPTSSSR
ncbi:hypothetical protein [Acidovorax sp. 93]|jgi:hypothetical protein|uniref:hypothetical protein n=1 Tax=unclassified Acidovorax TaxID=2684926 RepID=UPI000A7611F2|nr:hypothetical protein [Acidovorax sp. 93]